MPDKDPRQSPVSRWLATAPAWAFASFSILAAFSTYFCMYGYRKAFAAGTYEGGEIRLFGAVIDLKIALVIGQVVGYAISKIIGIKFNSEARRGQRAPILIGCIVISQISLVLFAIVPAWAKVIAIFLSALPLGMVWGLVVSFLEGRRLTDLLGAGLCCSFIIASGFAKTVGTRLMNLGISEEWMPAVAGLCYFPFFLIAVWMLGSIPHPSAEDIALRVVREPMNRSARRSFYRAHWLGLSLLMLIYIVLTVCRDFRDNFSVEMFAERGITGSPEVFIQTETPIGLTVVFLVGLLFLITDNRRALFLNHLYVLIGAVILIGSTALFDSGKIDVTSWMIANGFGLFLGYVPFNCILFDRLVAVLGTVATAVFLIYVADSLGYMGVVGILLYKNFGQHFGSMLDFYRWLCYGSGITIALSIMASWIYFRSQSSRR